MKIRGSNTGKNTRDDTKSNKLIRKNRKEEIFDDIEDDLTTSYQEKIEDERIRRKSRSKTFDDKRK